MTIDPPEFKDYIFNKFIEWEKQQPNKRSFVTVFARWLSDNSYEVEVKQQVVDAWIKGTVPKENKYILVLAEKLGEEVYDVLHKDRPNPLLQMVSKKWEFVSEETQERVARLISEEAAQYEAKKNTERVRKASKRGKTKGS